MENVKINIKFLDNNKERAVPAYATIGSAGMDIKAVLDHPVVLKPLERALIPTFRAGIQTRHSSCQFGRSNRQ